MTALSLSAPTVAQSPEYRIHADTSSRGVEITQHVNRFTFPNFKGAQLDWQKPHLPGTKPGTLRSIRMLMPVYDRQAEFAITAPSSSTGEIAGEINATTLTMHYRLQNSLPIPNPFSFTDNGARAVRLDQASLTWTQSIPLAQPITQGTAYVLITLYVIPQRGGIPEPESKTKLLFAVHEAKVQDMRIVSGALLADNVTLEADNGAFWKWQVQPIHAGAPSILDSTMNWPHGRTQFVEQRLRVLGDHPRGPTREKRCVEDLLEWLLARPGWLTERLFTQPSLCTLDPHPNSLPAERLPLVEVAGTQDAPPSVDSSIYEAAAFDPHDLDDRDAFDVAMSSLFCNENNDPGAPEGARCTNADFDAIDHIGQLPPEEIDRLLAQLAQMMDGGPAPATLRTENPRLERWLNADLIRAENALNAARAIVHVSDAREQPKVPIKKKNRKKPKLLKASCIETSVDYDFSGDAFQLCVSKAKRQRQLTVPIVALPPVVETGGTYHLRGTPEFERLARQFNNSGKSLPPKFSRDQLARYTAAIARDHAPTGDNLGIVFINDPTLAGNNDRFRFGVEHIWAPGRGGSANAGHREDWQNLSGLSVGTRDMLVHVIMAALTDVNAQFTQTREGNGNVVRTFDYFTFRHGASIFTIRHVRIVLGQNGMVITAYPMSGAKADHLNM